MSDQRESKVAEQMGHSQSTERAMQWLWLPLENPSLWCPRPVVSQGVENMWCSLSLAFLAEVTGRGYQRWVSKGNQRGYIARSVVSECPVRAIALRLGNSLPHTDASRFIPRPAAQLRRRECRSSAAVSRTTTHTNIKVIVQVAWMCAFTCRPSLSLNGSFARVFTATATATHTHTHTHTHTSEAEWAAHLFTWYHVMPVTAV